MVDDISTWIMDSKSIALKHFALKNFVRNKMELAIYTSIKKTNPEWAKQNNNNFLFK